MTTLQVSALFALTVATGFVAPEAADKPHIVYVLVDDWGWANVGYHRNPPTREVDTPKIDSLVKDGLELDQFYAYQFCSPSRSSLMTGRFPIHVNDQNFNIQNYNPKDPVSGYAGIPRNMTGIASKLKEAGYATHMVGKWHAGGATPTTYQLEGDLILHLATCVDTMTTTQKYLKSATQLQLLICGTQINLAQV